MVEEGEGGTLAVIPDDQFPIRVQKLGFSAQVKEGRAMLDQRCIVGCSM